MKSDHLYLYSFALNWIALHRNTAESYRVSCCFVCLLNVSDRWLKYRDAAAHPYYPVKILLWSCYISYFVLLVALSCLTGVHRNCCVCSWDCLLFTPFFSSRIPLRSSRVFQEAPSTAWWKQRTKHHHEPKNPRPHRAAQIVNDGFLLFLNSSCRKKSFILSPERSVESRTPSNCPAWCEGFFFLVWICCSSLKFCTF